MTKRRWIGTLIGVVLVALSAAAASGAEITIGPLLELPGADTMTVVWETDTAAVGSVILREPTGPEREIPSPGTQARHVVTIGGLAPDTRYEYAVVVDGAVAHRSWFRTLPKEGPYRVAFLGDTRHNDGITADLFSLMDTFHPQFIVMLGDFVGRANRAEDWMKEIFDPGKKVFDHIPIVGIPGNHDVQYDPDFAMFRRFFIRPENTGEKSLTYTATVESDLYIFLDIYSRRPFFTFTDGMRLYRLLKDAAKRPDIRHIFILSHEGVISHWRFRRGYSGLKPFTGIMGRYGVTAIISGHDHHYARGITYSGVPFFITGGGGSPLYEINRYNFYAALMGRTAVKRVTHHFLIMDVDGQTCAFSAVLPDGTVFDTAVIKKGN
jgi:hypothetical protein